MFIIRKKHFILFLSIFFLSVIVLLGSMNINSKVSSDYPIGQVKVVSGDSVTGSHVLTDLRAEREKIRKETISKLNDVVNNAASERQARQKASDKINEIYDAILKENICEEIIKVKGFEDVLVYIDSDSVDVSVYKEVLSENDIIVIKDIIINKTSVNNVKIVAVN